MTEIDLLKRVRADEPDADPLVLARARQRLLTPPPVRRRPARLVIAGGVALTLAGAFLAKDVVSHDGGPVPGTVADAGTVLADAAAKTQAKPDTPIPPGQFRQVTTHYTFVLQFGPKNEYRATTHGLAEVWIPADPTSQSVERVRHGYKVDFATPAAKAAAPKLAPYLLQRSKPSVRRLTCRGIPVDANLPPEILNAPCKPDWVQPSTAFLARQPRDPDALLAVLRKHTPPVGRKESALERSRAQHTPPDERAFQRISTALDSGIVPADLRAALYQAARKIPGIRLLDDVVTLDGRRGVAVGYTSRGQRHDLIIDPSTGQSIGSRLIDPRMGLPPDGVDSATSYTSRITATSPAVR